MSKLVVAGIALVALAVTAPAATPAPAPEAQAGSSLLTASRFGRGFAETRPGTILVARADGSGSRVLTRGWYSYVSPDGSQIAVLASDLTGYTNVRLELYASAGGAARRVLDLNCHPSWSPDSTKLACIEFVQANKPLRLLVVDVASGAKTTLATGFFDFQVSFSPDSTSLAYVQKPLELSRGGTLKVIDLATRAVRTIRGGGVDSPAWGPTEIAFAIRKRGIGRFSAYDTAVVKPDGSGFRRLTRFRPTADLFGPYPVAWSADGTRLLAGMNGRDAWTARESYAIDPARGGVRLIAHTVSPSALSRDGRFVVGQTGDAESTGLWRSTVVRVPWAGGAKRVLLRHAVHASVSG